MKQQQIEIINQLGLHARAASKLVATASRFSCDVLIARGEKQVNAKSIMGVLMLAAGKGVTLTLTTDGPEEDAAMQSMIELIENRFGEEA